MFFTFSKAEGLTNTYNGGMDSEVGIGGGSKIDIKDFGKFYFYLETIIGSFCKKLKKNEKRTYGFDD